MHAYFAGDLENDPKGLLKAINSAWVNALRRSQDTDKGNGDFPQLRAAARRQKRSTRNARALLHLMMSGRPYDSRHVRRRNHVVVQIRCHSSLSAF